MLGWDDNIILPVVQREKDSCGASAEPLGSEDIQVIHTYHSVCTEDLVIRSEGFPDVQPGDILEIYNEEETFSRLLLQCADGRWSGTFGFVAENNRGRTRMCRV